MNFRELIKEICIEENIEYTLISKEWIMALTKNNVTKCISGYRFNLNDHAIGSVIDDKYALYDLCKLLELPIIEHKLLFNPNSKLGNNTLELIDRYFQEYNENVVIKPNNGSEGIGVYHIKDREELLEKTNELFNSNFSISICPFYEIDREYRIIVLDNQVELVYEKIKPVVIGDGKSSLKDLLLELNYSYFNNKLNDKKYNRILKKSEIYEYDWRFNLSNGATAKLVREENLKNYLSNFALDVTKKLNTRFVSVDIIKSNGKFYLIEINSGVCINKVCNFIDKNYKITKEIYRKAINKMFD